MGRMTTLLTLFLLGIAPVVFSQQSTLQTPEDAYTSRDLIAWSQLQKPRPTPQPIPSRDTQIPQPEQPRDQQARFPANPQNEQEPAQSYTGEIIKDGSWYLLRMAGSMTYPLESNEHLQPYENRNVSVVGNIGPLAKVIHVLSIVPLP